MMGELGKPKKAFKDTFSAATAIKAEFFPSPATALPDGMEVVAWDFSEIEHILDETFHFASTSPGAQENINHVLDILRREPLVRADQAQSALAAMRVERDDALGCAQRCHRPKGRP